jgi:predicted ferric reductase
VREVRRRRADHAWDVTVAVGANAVVVAGLWLRHGGLHGVASPGGPMTAVGQLTGLFGMFAVLIELGLMARIPWLERHLGFDRLAVWHRWTGFAVVNLLVVHAVTITLGYAQSNNQSIPTQIGDFVRHYPDVLMAIVSLALFVLVAVTSVRTARRTMVRERWYSIHLYVYLAVALAFAHQLSVGSDFVDDPVARWWWSGLLVATSGALIWFRLVAPLLFNLRHRFRITHVVPEAHGVVSLYISGRSLGSVRAEAGQFFMVRLLTAEGWYRAHPFSLSAPPNGDFLRFTIKSLGDHTERLQRVTPRTRVALEGPLGTFTATRRTRTRVALIAGGIGITPLRALLDDLCGSCDAGDVTLLYRVATQTDILFGHELRLYSQHGVDVRVIVDDRIGDDRTDRLGVPALRTLLPDLAARDVYLCGPPPFVDAIERRVRRIGVPAARIHHERFDY